MRRICAASAVAVSCLLAACSASPTQPTAAPRTVPAPAHTAVATTTPTPAQVTQACPPGQSTMGCSGGAVLARGPRSTSATVTPPAGGEIPDVSDNNDTIAPVNWPAVKAWQLAHGWTPAGIFKLGEYTEDPDADANAAALESLGMWRAGYWFVRNTGCQYEATQILLYAGELGLKVVILDMEVPEAKGYAPCLSAALKAAGFTVVIYTAPGTWPGGSTVDDPAWIATYGPSYGCLVWTCKPVAWQFTDGSYGAVVNVPGITGPVDVSVDLGITNLPAPPPAKVAAAAMHYARYPEKRLAFRLDGAEHHVSERATVKRWDSNRCENPVRRRVCKRTHRDLQLARGRLLAMHQHGGRPWSYGKPSSIGARNQQLWHRLTKSRPVSSWKAGL